MNGAVISKCGTYRYCLSRQWEPGTLVNFIMLNPSTADATVDDPTIRRCIGFAKAWGHGGIVVTNLFAYRTTSPKELRRVAEERRGSDSRFGTETRPCPVGDDNDAVLLAQALRASLVVAAWGNHGWIDGRDAIVRHRLRRQHGIALYHLGLTKQDRPRHPLYLRKDTQPEIWI